MQTEELRSFLLLYLPRSRTREDVSGTIAFEVSPTSFDDV